MEQDIIAALDTLATMEKQLAFTAYPRDIEENERDEHGMLIDHNGEVWAFNITHDLMEMRAAIDDLLETL